MVPLPVIFELFDYNYWARDRQLKACLALTKRQFTQPMESSFGSLRSTLAHMAGSEGVWLERWQGRSPQALPPAEQFPTVEALAAYWREVEHGAREFLTGLTDQALAQPVSYVNFQGETWTYPLWRMLVHVVNHASYHRGQVTTLLRQLGAEPVQVDYLLAQDMGFRP
jgi:uncharacterized damage-inducible protein DinB